MTVELNNEACYYRLTVEPVDRTVSVSDLIMVDVDAAGEPIGVEFVVPQGDITDTMVSRLAARFPQLAQQIFPGRVSHGASH